MYMIKNNNHCVVAVALCVLITLFCVQNLLAGVRGTLMGNLDTVVSNGPLDAGRNPALLATQTGNSAAGAYLLYRAYQMNDEDVESDGLEYDVPRGSSADLVAGFSTRIGSSILGISIESNDKGSQFEQSEAHITMQDSSMLYKLDTKSRASNPALNTSIGISLDSNTSIGFQLNTGFSYQKDETEMTAISGVPVEIVDIDSETRSLLFEIGFGYLHRTDKSQVGLYFTSGIMQFQWADYEYRQNIAGYSGTYSLHNYFKYTSGMSLSAGVFQQVTSSLGVAFEAGYRFPYSYKYTQYKYVGGPEPGETQAVSVTSEGVIVFKGGVSLALNSSLTVSTGLLYTRSRQSQYEDNTATNNEEKMKRQKFNIWLVTAGAEYVVSPNIVLGAGAMIFRTYYDNDEDNRGSGGSVFGAMDLSMTSLKFNIAAGITYTL